MPNLLLNELTVSAFRGIRGPLPLRFDAPLTVVVADNGTGKTSLCDALEWLLTGRVERLARGAVATSQLAHIDAVGQTTVVSALLQIDQKQVRLARTLVGDQARLSSSTPGWKKLADKRLLEALTPDRIGLGAHTYKKTSARAEWLRAVRFLTPDNLTQLIDRNDRSEEIRGRLFAALFGAGELKENVRNFEKLLGEFRLSEKDVQQCEAKISASELMLRALRDEAAAPFFERFDALGQELAVAAGLSWRLADDLRARSGQFLSLEEKVISRERELEQRQARLRELEAGLPRLQGSAASQQRWLVQLRPPLAGRLDTLRAAAEPQRKAGKDLLRDTETARRQLAAASRLAGRGDELAGRLTAWNEAWLRVQTNAAVPLDGARLQQEIATAERERAGLRDVAGGLIGLREAIGAERDSINGLADLQTKRTALLAQVPPDTVQRDLARRLAETTEKVAGLRRQRDAETGRWQRWVAEARGFLQHQPGPAHCPLCGHDHGTPDAFAAAARQVLSDAPAESAVIRSFRTEEDNLQKLAAEQERLETLRSQVKALDDEIARRAARAQAFHLRCQRLQLPPDLLTVVNAGQLLEDAATAQNRLIEKNGAHIESLRAQFKLVQEWRDLTQVALQLVEFLPPDARLLISQPPPLASSPADWGARFAKAREIAARELIAAQQLTARLEPQLERAQKATAEMEAQLKVAEQQLKSAEEAAKADELAVKRGLDQAKSIGAADFSDSALESVRRDLEQHVRQLADSRTKLELVRKHLNDATLAEQHHQQRQRISAELAQLKKELKFLGEKRAMRKEIEEEIRARTVRLDEWIRNESEPLQRIINALFLRAQGVAYIDQILPDETGSDGRLNWKGAVDGARSLLTVELSQGQRQDLALAIFLARATHEGGTFVLDEPLAHLDDVNRLAVLDSLRSLVVSRPAEEFRLILTTASWALARHLRAKFFHVRTADGRPALNVIPLVGDPRRGVTVEAATW